MPNHSPSIAPGGVKPEPPGSDRNDDDKKMESEMGHTGPKNDGKSGAQSSFGGGDATADEDDPSLALLQDALRFVNRYNASQDVANLNIGIELTRSGLQGLPANSLNHVLGSYNLASAVMTRFERENVSGDLDEVILLLGQVVEILPPDQPVYPGSLYKLGYALYRRFDQQGNTEDLDESVSFHRRALDCFPATHPNHSSILNNLADILSARAVRKKNAQDIDEAISSFKRILQLTPPLHLSNASSLDNVGKALKTRFELLGGIENIDEAILFHRKALELLPTTHPLRYHTLDDLAVSLSTRYEFREDMEDLEESLSIYIQILELIPPPHPGRSRCLNNFANALRRRFQQGGDAEDLDNAILLHRHALELRPTPHPARSQSLSNLAGVLWTRFEHRGDVQTDLDESISLHRQALQLSFPSQTHQAESLSGLGNALLAKFRLDNDISILDECITSHEQALKLRPPSHPHHGDSLNNLANGLSTRFDYLGDPMDLDKAVSFHRQALEDRHSRDPNYPRSLNNLAVVLFLRYEAHGRVEDLDETIALHRRAVEYFPQTHPDRSNSLGNLASALLTRAEHWNRLTDLEEAISFNKEALRIRSSFHPEYSNTLSNLAISLNARFQRLCDPRDIDECIILHKQALEFRPLPNSKHSDSLNGIANALLSRFEKKGDPRDLNGAISYHRRALELVPPPHRDYSLSLKNLALSLSIRYMQQAQVNDLQEAMSLFYKAAKFPAQSSFRRFLNARSWAYNADLHDHQSAMEAFGITLDILPELAAFGLDIQSRQKALTQGTDGMARKAARHAIRVGEIGRALEFLETGRGVFWSQFLSLRPSFEQLPHLEGELAKDLQTISTQLEEASYREHINSNPSNRERLSWEEQSSQFEIPARKWTETVNKIRELEGFKNFLRPKKLSDLQVAAKERPIVYLIANENISDCLIITLTDVHHIALRKLPVNHLLALATLIRTAATEDHIPLPRSDERAETPRSVSQSSVEEVLQRWMDDDDIESTRGMRPERNIPGHLSSDDIFRHVLRTLWDEVVKPVIEHLKLKKSNERQRLTWCATGVFSFLPIHAAGCYEDGIVDCASDYIISSYTPTIGALHTSKPSPMESLKMVAVIESRTLPQTRQELERLEKHVPPKSLVKFESSHVPASIDKVASEISTASIVHFACHGKQNFANPLSSGLEIGDDMLTISRIMKGSVPKGSLAFLSACETAMGDGELPDEAMSIAASLLFTGFRSVVATMWRMWDKDGPIIADAFYGVLFRGPTGEPVEIPDTIKSAEALAVAIKELRGHGVPFRRWVPFVHMGN